MRINLQPITGNCSSQQERLTGSILAKLFSAFDILEKTVNLVNLKPN